MWTNDNGPDDIELHDSKYEEQEKRAQQNNEHKH